MKNDHANHALTGGYPLEFGWLAATELELDFAAMGVVDNVWLRHTNGSLYDAAMEMLVGRFDMYTEAAAENTERPSERKNKDKQDPPVPPRCIGCADIAICDTDFCLRWWH